MKLNRFVFIIPAFCLFSCEKEVELKVTPSEPRYVIEALLPQDSTATVRIIRSKNYGEDSNYPPVSGAVVSLSDQTGKAERLEQSSSGVYVSKTMRGISGNTYSLTVEVDGKLYSSVETMPYPIFIQELIMDNTTAGPFPRIYYQDPAGIENYYRVILYINGKRMPDMEVMDDAYTDGKLNSNLILFNPAYNGGNEIRKGDHILIEMQCLDKSAYTYFEALNRINSTLANPESNMKGGALGYFCAFTADRKEIIADW